MKRLLSMSVIVSLAFCLYAENKPKADVYVRVTDDLPKPQTEIMTWYNGILSVTNTGETAFVVVTDERCVGGTILFYRQGNEEEQRVFETAHGGIGKRWQEEERKEVSDDYYAYIKEKIATTTLQPGENITLKCKFDFRLSFHSSGRFYKGEMYLGSDTWVPVHITPTLGTLFALEHGKDGKPTGEFYYSQEGTNQYLYVKTEEGKFKRAGEMKVGSRPQKEREENAVTFELPDGTRKKLTHTEARQIIQEREQQNN